MSNDLQSSLVSSLLQIGPHLPKVARIDPLPDGTPKGPAGHEVVYEHVFRLLTNQAPRQPASAFPLCPEDYALTLLYMAVKWTGPQVFGYLDVVDEGGRPIVRVPPQYRPPAPVMRSMMRMLPLDPKARVCFSNGELDYGNPVDPKIEANELLLVFYDEGKIVTLYWAAMID
jgi:hypothetical protein